MRLRIRLIEADGDVCRPRLRKIQWKAFCILILVISFLPLSSFSQIGGGAPLIKYAQKQAMKANGNKSDPTIGLWSFSNALKFLEENRGIEAGTILPIRISTWSIPVTLVRLDYDDFDNVRIVPTISIGIGYFWISGSSIIDTKSESVRIYPKSILGIATSFGAISKVDGNTGIEGSFAVTGVIGIHPMTMSLGYDFLTKSPVIGVGFRVDFFALSRNNYRISRFFGRVAHHERWVL